MDAGQGAYIERCAAIREVVMSGDEHDGFSDVEFLLGHASLLSADGALLAVTLVKPNAKAQQRELEARLRVYGEQFGRWVERLGHCAEKSRAVSAVFYLVGVSARRMRQLSLELKGIRLVLHGFEV